MHATMQLRPRLNLSMTVAQASGDRKKYIVVAQTDRIDMTEVLKYVSHAI